MPRKKPDTATAIPAGDTNKTPGAEVYLARYLRLLVGNLGEYIVNGDEAGEEEVTTEINEFVSRTFRGIAKAAVEALIAREREQAKQFAGRLVDYVTVDGVLDPIHDGPDRVIEHEEA